MTVMTMLDRRVRDGLLAFAGDPVNLGTRAIAGVIASGCEGRIPALEEGLGARRFAALAEKLFPGADPGQQTPSSSLFPAVEYGDLMRLLLDHRSRKGEETEMVAHAMAISCLGASHLWEDMHLDNSAELSALIRCYFGSLAALNVRDMKWKYFFYKQICAREGFNACRAPRCEECCDQERCFGPEDGPGAERP